MSNKGISQAQTPTLQPQRFVSSPRTTLGKWSIALAAVFVVLFALNSVLFVSGIMAIPQPQTFGPIYVILMFGCALAAGIVGMVAVLRRAERSWLVWLAILPAIFMLTLLLGEFLIPH